jgi:hypothetical protein
MRLRTLAAVGVVIVAAAATAEYLQGLGASVSANVARMSRECRANVVDNSGAAPIISPVFGLGGCAHDVR